MTETVAEAHDLWEMLCGSQVSPKEIPFPSHHDATTYLNTIIEDSGIDSLQIPPFNQYSLEQLAEILWRFQWQCQSS